MALDKKVVESLEKVIGQLESVHTEISQLAKKSPNDGINTFKLKLINHALQAANTLLVEQYVPISGFSTFDEDDLPTNSDVVFVLRHYMEEAERFRADNISYNPIVGWEYDVTNSDGVIKAAEPRKLKK